MLLRIVSVGKTLFAVLLLFIQRVIIIILICKFQRLGKWVRPKKRSGFFTGFFGLYPCKETHWVLNPVENPVGFLALGFSHAKKQMKTYQTAKYNAILDFVTTM